MVSNHKSAVLIVALVGATLSASPGCGSAGGGAGAKSVKPSKGEQLDDGSYTIRQGDATVGTIWVKQSTEFWVFGTAFSSGTQLQIVARSNTEACTSWKAYARSSFTSGSARTASVEKHANICDGPTLGDDPSPGNSPMADGLWTVTSPAADLFVQHGNQYWIMLRNIDTSMTATISRSTQPVPSTVDGFVDLICSGRPDEPYLYKVKYSDVTGGVDAIACPTP